MLKQTRDTVQIKRLDWFIAGFCLLMFRLLIYATADMPINFGAFVLLPQNIVWYGFVVLYFFRQIKVSK